MKNRTNRHQRLLNSYNRYVRKFNRLRVDNGKKSVSSKKLDWLKKRINELGAQLTFIRNHALKLSKAALITSGIFFAPQIAKSQSFDVQIISSFSGNCG